MAYVQEAQGEFTIEVSGPYHCGPDHTTPKRFPYKVTIHYHDGALDENGFLLDNTSFREYFNTLGCTSLSCERLCDKAANDLHNATNGRAQRTAVQIWAIPGHAAITKVIE